MIYLNLGRREQGKTTLAYFLIRRASARVIFDPRGLFPTTHRITGPTDLQTGFDRLVDKQSGELVITPDRNVRDLFNETCAELKSWIQDPITRGTPIAFIVDELWMVVERTRLPEDFDWLLRCATRAAITIVCTAHRPSDVPTNIRAISDVWCLFRCTQEHDLQVIRERCSDDVVLKVTQLGQRQFVAWDDTRSTWTLHDHPDRWFVPLRDPMAADAPLESEPRPIDDLAGTPGRTNKVDIGLPFK